MDQLVQATPSHGLIPFMVFRFPDITPCASGHSKEYMSRTLPCRVLRPVSSWTSWTRSTISALILSGCVRRRIPGLGLDGKWTCGERILDELDLLDALSLPMIGSRSSIRAVSWSRSWIHSEARSGCTLVFTVQRTGFGRRSRSNIMPTISQICTRKGRLIYRAGMTARQES